MKISLLILLLMLVRVASAQDEGDPSGGESFPLGISPVGELPADLGGPLDSLYRLDARLEIDKALEALSSTDFWHRLMPTLALSATLGIHDLAFQQSAVTVLLPRDAYRLSARLPVSELLDGSAHERAQIELARAEARYAIVLARQRQRRIDLTGKLIGYVHERDFQAKHVRILDSLRAYQEILFLQGRTEYHLLAKSRIDVLRERLALEHLQTNIRALEATLGKNGPP